LKAEGGCGGAAASRAAPVARRAVLDELYERLNRREYVHPDPLEFLYGFDELRDREVVGLVASSLAYGRVRQILRSVENVLDRLGPAPADFVLGAGDAGLESALEGFKHRFTTGSEVARMLSGARGALERHGTLGAMFTGLVGEGDETVLPALTSFVASLTGRVGACPLPDPERGSACKRLHLFLRWMVRSDDVDPGGWDDVPASKLVVPLDTHMHRLSLRLGLTDRKQANARTALEITRAFREINAEDPVKYDFALTRLGIRDDMDAESMLFDGPDSVSS
jgi:uncharacterized protein (TIGR02757 family)